ncbi:undecaprenyl-diphosphate phosphatase [Achromobacter aloeverae]|uniref:undecaprenyl-diphosphate phosphatase n=1 Tax=Achromobacter aloeverae TaxID=1750518 RepID=UPI00195B55A0|nr:undecaprenyl-diphosphate phosphatase [Achromobacter aloeverae]
MHFLQILILAVVQGAAELLPVSSSAHVILAEKLMGLDPTTPEMTMLLVMLHTGTMFAAIVYFWKAWVATYFSSWSAFRTNALRIVAATAATGVVGLALLFAIKRLVFGHASSFEIEHLFGNATLMAAALAAAGVLIIVAARIPVREGDLTLRHGVIIGAVQGLCLPFRGFSRSGATISTGLALGVSRRRAEEFSFALAVVLTPPVIVKEAWRLYQAAHANAAGGGQAVNYAQLLGPSLLGMVFSFLAGLLALRWLSKWLEQGRWHFFGIYCLVAACVVLAVG